MAASEFHIGAAEKPNELRAGTQFDLALRIGVYGLKTALMVNALAAGAFLILTNFSRSVPDYIEAFAWFGLAAVVTIIGFSIGYCCRLPYPNGLLESQTKPHEAQHSRNNSAVAGFLALLAIAAVASGAAQALEIYQILPS
jgi:hypothetical protein